MEIAVRAETSNAATESPCSSSDFAPAATHFETLAPSADIPSHELADWREDFTRWLDSACVCSPRGFGGLNRLHIAFCEWVVGQGGVPCTRDTFERLLAERGFLIGEVCGVLLVSGLTFRKDFEEYW